MLSLQVSNGIIVSKMKKEYDFSNGVRGKYAKAHKKGVTIIKLVRRWVYAVGWDCYPTT